MPSSLSSPSPAVAAALLYVEEHSRAMDASHDMNHIQRVLALTRRIAVKEGLGADALETASLAAALHDIGDAKYVQNGAAALRQALDHLVAQDLMSAARVQRIQEIILRVSFREELPGGTCTPQDLVTYPELGALKDADQLDAIGAVGIARCFTFGGARGRPLYDPQTVLEDSAHTTATATVLPSTKEAYATGHDATGQKTEEDTLSHFHKKLLHLAGRMKTQEGKALAQSRHAFMLEFVERFTGEIRGEK